jgi:lactobin A/cerein 7B family class IIb bacteriocin
MRELSDREIETVNGGILPVAALGIIGGAAGGALAGYHDGGWRGAAAGGALGAATGVAGAMTSLTTGVVRLAWGVRTAGLGAAGSMYQITPDPVP